MYEVKAIVQRDRMDDILRALHASPELPGVTASVVRGFGRRVSPRDGAQPVEYGETELAKLETIVPEDLLQRVVETVRAVAHTGRPGDGKIFVLPVADAIRIRSGVHGSEAL